MARRLGGLDATALLGLTGTVVAALLSAGFLGDFLVNPAVYVEVKNNTGTSKPVMLVTNDGSKPAHNLSMFIQSSSDKIVNVTNIFSTADVTLVEPKSMTLERGRPVPINNNSLQIFIPMLSSGIGSKVEMETLLESQSGGISVTAVYDEGSTLGSDQPSYVRGLSILFSIIYASFIAFSVGAIGYAIFEFWSRRSIRARFIKNLVFTLENLRRKLEDGPNIPERIYLYKSTRGQKNRFKRLQRISKRKGLQYSYKDFYLSEVLKEARSGVQKIMKDPKDYMIIDDLNSKIENRNNKIETELEAIKNTSPEEYRHEVKRLNTECLDQIYKALNIEWENYY
jgi:hypothetical protein